MNKKYYISIMLGGCPYYVVRVSKYGLPELAQSLKRAKLYKLEKNAVKVCEKLNTCGLRASFFVGSINN